MKHEQIRERCVYEVQVGKTPTGEVKKALVTVMQFNPKTNSWTCRTKAGKDMVVKDLKRFQRAVGSQSPSATPKAAPGGRLAGKKGPAPKPKPNNARQVSQEEKEQLLENLRKATREEKIVTEALSLGFALDEDKMFQISQTLWDAQKAAAEAGVTLNTGGRSNGTMSGKDAAYRVLEEEGRPMRARELCDLAHERGYCDMPGKTPWATIASTLTVDINMNGENSRFIKFGPGLFDINK